MWERFDEPFISKFITGSWLIILPLIEIMCLVLKAVLGYSSGFSLIYFTQVLIYWIVDTNLLTEFKEI